jgi:hypothetical protein
MKSILAPLVFAASAYAQLITTTYPWAVSRPVSVVYVMRCSTRAAMSADRARKEHDIVDVCWEACGRCGSAAYPRQRCIGMSRPAENIELL